MEEEKIFIPKTLEESHDLLDKYLQDRDAFMNYPEDKILAVAHLWGFGRWIRNNWNLWWSPELYERAKEENLEYPSTKPELVNFFHNLGVEHADDMSGIIIMSYYKKLNNKPYDIDADVKHIKAFYENQEAEQQIIQSKKNEKE